MNIDDVRRQVQLSGFVRIHYNFKSFSSLFILHFKYITHLCSSFVPDSFTYWYLKFDVHWHICPSFVNQFFFLFVLLFVKLDKWPSSQLVKIYRIWAASLYKELYVIEVKDEKKTRFYIIFACSIYLHISIIMPSGWFFFPM